MAVVPVPEVSAQPHHSSCTEAICIPFQPITNAFQTPAVSVPVASSWRSTLFPSIQEEGLDLSAAQANPVIERNVNFVTIDFDDVKSEIEYWESSVVCYIFLIKPPFHIVIAVARRTWGKFGIVKVSLLKNGAFMVKFRNIDGRNKAIEAGPVLFDSKPVIMKPWAPG